jgi:hypothetical protein
MESTIITHRAGAGVIDVISRGRFHFDGVSPAAVYFGDDGSVILGKIAHLTVFIIIPAPLQRTAWSKGCDYFFVQ